MPFIEEARLLGRFGQDYIIYKQNVPRWIPRLRPWNALVEKEYLVNGSTGDKTNDH
jgi:hypothetical protein